MEKKTQNLDDVWRMTKQLGALYVENARLALTEKLTRLMSAVALAAIIFVFVSMCLLFLTVCVSDVLSEAFNPWIASLIVGGFYLLAILVVLLLRRQLLINPICRFLSRLIIEHPTESHPENEL